ncbi:MAG: hypothetical protein ACRDTA_22610 [Pseudonocardiaceae bacterium]
MLLTVVLLFVAVGLLVVALGTGHIALAWVSVVLSAVVSVMIITRWRRRLDEPEAEPVVLLDDEPVDAVGGDQLADQAQEAALVTAVGGDQPADPAQNAVPVGRSPHSAVNAAAQAQVGPVAALAASAGADQVAEDAELADAEDAEPGEEDTDAADLLVVYELTDQVLVVDEHPRYHLTRCPWPEQARAERLPVREARELGFTPCDRCRPDTALARRYRATSATTGGT